MQFLTKLLKLSKHEQVVYKELLKRRESRPLPLALYTRIPRASVYVALEHLMRRGLVESVKRVGRKYWKTTNLQSVYDIFAQARTEATTLPRHEPNIVRGPHVVVYEGKDAVMRSLTSLFTEQRNVDFYTLQGKGSDAAWSKHFTVEEIAHFNEATKKNKFVSRHIFEEGIFEQALKQFGPRWANAYLERTGAVVQIPSQYISHKAQIWLAGKTAYIVSMETCTIIEIHDPDVTTMFRELFQFIHDQLPTSSIDSRLKKAIEKRN